MPESRGSRTEKARTRTSRQQIKKSTTLTCRGCRSRKIRCDGAQPICGICLAYNDECHYDKVPPMTQVLAMTDRIAELERLVQDLQRNASQTSAPPSVAPTNGSTDGGEASHASLDEGHFVRSVPSQATVSPKDATLERGETYYETTSAIHDPGTVRSRSDGSGPLRCKLPTMNPKQLAYWADRVHEAASTLLGIPSHTIRHLLETHWTWVHPTFMFVNREIFLKDTATGGQYSSPLLLSVLCLHSTRFTDRHLSEELLARSNLLLGQEIHKGGSVTLAQALLQLSAREIGEGNVSQSWLYSGMASRICIDLGLYSRDWTIPADADSGVVRRNQISYQLAWSCYLWDKAISLYFGRSPSLPEPPMSESNFDTSTDEDIIWRPTGDDQGRQGTYSHKISCFRNFCKLGVIINDILLNIYGRLRTATVLEFVQKTQHRLHRWRSESPKALTIYPSSRPQHCPPPHILTQNLLYYTSIILLHRPFKNIMSSRSTCRDAAAGVENILLLMEQHFGLDKCTYVMCYCAYTAATVAVQDTRDEVPGASDRLETYLRALKNTKASCPGIQRSIEIIASCMRPKTLEPSTTSDASKSHAGDESVYPPQMFTEDMPAFPHDIDHSNQLLDGMDMDSLSAPPQSFLYLDSFPQGPLDFTDGAFDQFDFGISEFNGLG